MASTIIINILQLFHGPEITYRALGGVLFCTYWLEQCQVLISRVWGWGNGIKKKKGRGYTLGAMELRIWLQCIINIILNEVRELFIWWRKQNGMKAKIESGKNSCLGDIFVLAESFCNKNDIDYNICRILLAFVIVAVMCTVV